MNIYILININITNLKSYFVEFIFNVIDESNIFL